MRTHSTLFQTTLSLGFLALCQCSSTPGPGGVGQNTQTGGTTGAAGATTTGMAGAINSGGGMAGSTGGSTSAAGAAPTGAAGMTSAGGAAMMGGSGPMGGANANGGSGMGGASANAGSGGASANGGAGTGGAGTGGAGMGGAGTGGAGTGGAGVGGAATGGDFTVTSESYEDGAEMPDMFTCTGIGSLAAGPIPQLTWTGAPEGTLSFGLTFIDTTLAPENMNGYHWAAWDIPLATTSIPEGDYMPPEGSDQYGPIGDGFLGPCPNFGGGSANTDTYELVVYALDVAELPSPPQNVGQLEALMLEHALDTATLTCTSSASPGGT